MLNIAKKTIPYPQGIVLSANPPEGSIINIYSRDFHHKLSSSPALVYSHENSGIKCFININPDRPTTRGKMLKFYAYGAFTFEILVSIVIRKPLLNYNPQEHSLSKD